MALDWDIGNIKQWKKVCISNDHSWSWTNNFIWATLALHMGQITKDNWKDWAARYLIMFPPPKYYTQTQSRRWKKYVVKKVYQHIGLSTNVSKAHQRPTGKWYQQIIDRKLEQAKLFIDIAHAENEITRTRKNERNIMYRKRKRIAKEIANTDRLKETTNDI